MEKIGFIGYGHMGSVVLKGFLKAGALSPEQVVISNRTPGKLAELKTAYPMVRVTGENREVAVLCTTLFVCVDTYQVKPVLDEIGDVLHANTHLVSIAGGLEITSLERVFPSAISKLIPTMIAEVREGVSLVCHNKQVTSPQKDKLGNMLSRIGEVKVIPEDWFEVAADLTSCAPGLLSAIFEQIVRAAMQHSSLSYEDACALLLPTISGTARLMRKHGESFGALIQRVATKGGSTAGGVSVLNTALPGVFDRIIIATGERHEIRKQKTREQFAG